MIIFQRIRWRSRRHFAFDKSSQTCDYFRNGLDGLGDDIFLYSCDKLTCSGARPKPATRCPPLSAVDISHGLAKCRCKIISSHRNFTQFNCPQQPTQQSLYKPSPKRQQTTTMQNEQKIRTHCHCRYNPP